jgi:murein DD-endopeptidase MepM/ murein hydrolase activator NlpD
MTESGCAISSDWVVAAASGVVVRSDTGIVVLDLDGDGREQSGWALLYLHIATNGRVEEGTLLEEGDLIGHPSCEGGIATGTHIHIARKYNGEWILADGPLPFELSGWVASAGSKPYQGALTKDDEIVLACPCATQETLIKR